MAVDEDLSALLSSTALILVGVVLASASKLIERIVIARLFGPEMYGEVAMALAVMTIGSSFAVLGFNHGVPRYVSRYDDERDIRGTWLTALVLSVLAGIVIAVALYLNVGFITGHLFEDGGSAELLRLFVLCIPVQVALTIGVSAIRGMENTRYKMYVNDLLHPALRIVVLAALLAGGFGIVAAGYAYFAAAVVALVIAHLLFNRLFSLRGAFTVHARTLLTFSAPLVATALLSILLTRTDTLMLGYFRPSDEVGLYNAAYPLANSLLMVVMSFGYLYLPLTSRLDADGKRDEVREIYRITTKWAYVVTFPAFLVFLLFPDDVLSIFFGASYAGGGVALAILSLGFFTSAAAGRNRETLSALGDTKNILAADVAALALNVVLNFVLIPAHGLVGAAAASASAYVIRNLVISGVLSSRFGISPFTSLTVRTYAVLPLVLLLPVAVASRWVTLTATTLPIALVLLGGATLAIVFLADCLQAEDLVVIEFVEERVGFRFPVPNR